MMMVDGWFFQIPAMFSLPVHLPPTTLTHMDAFIAQLQLLLLLHFQLLKSCFRSSQEKICSSSIFHHFTINSPCFHHVMPRCFTIFPSSKCSSRSSSATWRSAAQRYIYPKFQMFRLRHLFGTLRHFRGSKMDRHLFIEVLRKECEAGASAPTCIFFTVRQRMFTKFIYIYNI